MAALQNGLARVNVSRRQLLQSSAATALIAVSYWVDDRTVSKEQLNGAPPGAVTTFNRRTLSYFSADYSTEHIWDLATAVELSRIGRDIVEIHVAIRFDPRVLATRDVLIVEANGEFHAIRAQETSTDGLIAEATFILDPHLWKQHHLRFSPPLIAKTLYPKDAIDGVLVPTVELTFVDTRGNTHLLTRALATELTRPVAPWGVEVAAAWDVVSRSADGTEFYRAPVGLLVTGTGPNPTPAGMQVEMRVAESAAGAPSIRSYGNGMDELPAGAITSTTTTDGIIRTVTFVVTESLGPETSRSISLEWAEFVAQHAGDAPPRALVRVTTEGDDHAPRRGPAGTDTIVDMATAPAQVKQDLARKGG
ncbi:hypothetical protein [Agromyces sp. NPDC049794]|uniref:hypothetical protein n=1 Tax=unclassified Agromyces TaxID=2639701 RepID=UPI0033FE8B5F